MFADAEIIHAYTRAQAIKDGDLMDVTALAAEAGFRVPVALTAAAWSDCVEWDRFDELTDPSQSAAGRLWDVLNVARHVARLNPKADRQQFQVRRVPRRGHTTAADVPLTMVLAPGDSGEPVLTIGFAEDF
jgi:hypothetical protein